MEKQKLIDYGIGIKTGTYFKTMLIWTDANGIDRFYIAIFGVN